MPFTGPAGRDGVESHPNGDYDAAVQRAEVGRLTSATPSSKPQASGDPEQDFVRLMSRLPGMISLEEAALLRDAAAAVRGGCIVEIGSWRGKSAVAIALGVLKRPPADRPRIYCVEPHQPFAGALGGRFGPSDRAGFYEAMLEAGVAPQVALINLPSVRVAAGWQEPVAMMFIDGDHRYPAVRADLDAWRPHLAAGALVIFDDALDPGLGPRRLIGELEADAAFDYWGGVGKIAALVYRGPGRTRPAAAPAGPGPENFLASRLGEFTGRVRAIAETITLDNFVYSTNISLKHKYIYVETPKVACSTIKKFLICAELEKKIGFSDPEHLHLRQFSPLLNPMQAGDFSDLCHNQEFFKFCFVRDPYTRLLSAYIDKIRGNKVQKMAILREIGKPERLAEYVSFEEFVDAVIEESICNMDSHWRVQYYQTLQEYIKYDFIGKFENFDYDFSHVLSRIGLDNEFCEKVDSHASNAADHLDRFYTKSIRRKVARKYEKDFEAFGYPP